MPFPPPHWGHSTHDFSQKVLPEKGSVAPELLHFDGSESYLERSVPFRPHWGASPRDPRYHHYVVIPDMDVWEVDDSETHH